MSPRFPALPQPGPRLGVGFDMRWGAGFVADAAGDTAAPAVKRFLDRYQPRFAHAFVSWQPRGRARLDLQDYLPAFDDLFASLGAYEVRALHHTALNLAASARYERAELLAFTNALIDRYGFAWVNEDLGFWSLDGRTLPYPLPPALTDAGLAACVRNIRQCREALHAPLLVEFPGFSDGFSLCVGDWDAYDFFREAVQRSGAACTLDVGHLLSWRWLRGFRGDALLDDLERLPLEACFEVHLSGVEVKGERFVDAHHGVLVEAQLALLQRLRALCPNLGAITFEDPVFDAQGALAQDNLPSLHRLEALLRTPVPPEPTAQIRDERALPDEDLWPVEQGLDRLLHDPSAYRALPADSPLAALPEVEVAALGREVRRRIGERGGLGVRSLRERFKPVFAAWSARETSGDEGLLAAFAAHDLGRAWADVTPDRPSLEQAFADFARGLDLVPGATLDGCLHDALIDVLAVVPHPLFRVPDWVQGGPGCWCIVAEGDPARLYAVVGSRVLKGAVPALTADLLRGAEASVVEARHGLPPGGSAPVLARLRDLGLLQAGTGALRSESARHAK